MRVARRCRRCSPGYRPARARPSPARRTPRPPAVGDVALPRPGAAAVRAHGCLELARGASRSRNIKATAAPRSASISTMPRPMPREPPVTTATRPARLRSCGTGGAAAVELSRQGPETSYLHGYHPATRSTTLNSAPPLAKLLTSSDAVRRVAHRVSRWRGEPQTLPSRIGPLRPAIGGTRPRARTATPPRRQRAGRAGFAERALDRRDDGARLRRTARQRRRLRQRSSVARRVGRGIDDVDIRRREPGVLERQPHRAYERLGSSGQALSGTAALDAADAENLAVPPRPARRMPALQPEADAAFAEHEPVARGVERRQPGREHRVGRHHAEAIVRLEEGLEDGVDAAGDES